MLLHSAFLLRCVAWPRPTGCTAEDMPGQSATPHHPGPEGAVGLLHKPEKATGAPKFVPVLDLKAPLLVFSWAAPNYKRKP